MRTFLPWALAVPLLVGCAADTFVTGDASVDAGDAGSSVTCGAASCLSGESCCIYTDGGGGAQYQCGATCAQSGGGAQLSTLGCTSSADCVGQACCIRRSNGGNVSVCEAQCSAANGEVQLCDPNAADAGCPPSQPCSTDNLGDWGLPSGFATCGGRGVP